jgi:riboflavin synthase
MFTGIITGVGRIVAVHAFSSLPTSAAKASADGASDLDNNGFGKRLCIEAPTGYLDDVGLGDSIALNGACMTVTQLDPNNNQFSIDISAESLEKTAGLVNLGPINLEKALRAHDRLGGHIVSGHVDGIGRVSFFQPVGESWKLRIMAPQDMGKFLAYKGSITVNGVSLTVNRVVDSDAGTELSINLIPHTVENTALGQLKAGSDVNLEIDLIARYVERMLSHTAMQAGKTSAAGA